MLNLSEDDQTYCAACSVLRMVCRKTLGQPNFSVNPGRHITLDTYEISASDADPVDEEISRLPLIPRLSYSLCWQEGDMLERAAFHSASAAIAGETTGLKPVYIEPAQVESIAVPEDGITQKYLIVSGEVLTAIQQQCPDLPPGFNLVQYEGFSSPTLGILVKRKEDAYSLPFPQLDVVLNVEEDYTLHTEDKDGVTVNTLTERIGFGFSGDCIQIVYFNKEESE